MTERDENGLTERQRFVLTFIARAEAAGLPPTMREIAAAAGVTSTNGVNDHLRRLEVKGFITRTPMVSRGIHLTKEGRRVAGSNEDLRPHMEGLALAERIANLSERDRRVIIDALDAFESAPDGNEATS